MCVQIPVHVSSVTRITISETTTDVLRPLTVKGVQQLPQPEMEFKSAKVKPLCQFCSLFRI